MNEPYLSRLARISTFIFDVDGVLTDGSVTLLPTGDQVRNMNVKDGYALQLAIKLGYRIAIISGGKSEAVRQRLNGLGVQDVHLGASDKLEVFDEYLLTWDLKADNILYMGDDLPDYQVLSRVGLAACPLDAAEEIKSICHYISPAEGGTGCVRDVIEKALRVQGKWFDPSVHGKKLDEFKW
ncbi:MAG: KdsC family phosphatase [Salibacteraceae bacterium]